MKTTIVRYPGGITAIDQEMVRAFVIEGTDRALILDTGAEAVDFAALTAEITALPQVLCLSHSDEDHIANLGGFARAYLHPDEVPLLRAAAPDLPLTPVDEGYRFELGGRVLEVLALPGHTPGSLGLLDRANKLLFAGDTLSYSPIFMFGPGRDLAAYRRTLARLQAMAAQGVFDTVYPCHNTCPLGVAVIDELLACADGIAAGTLAPQTVTLPMPGSPTVTLYKSGHGSILMP